MRETDTDLWTPWNAPSRHPRPTPPTGSTTAIKSVTYVPGLICYRCPRLFRVAPQAGVGASAWSLPSTSSMT